MLFVSFVRLRPAGNCMGNDKKSSAGKGLLFTEGLWFPAQAFSSDWKCLSSASSYGDMASSVPEKRTSTLSPECAKPCKARLRVFPTPGRTRKELLCNISVDGGGRLTRSLRTSPNRRPQQRVDTTAATARRVEGGQTTNTGHGRLARSCERMFAYSEQPRVMFWEERVLCKQVQ